MNSTETIQAAIDKLSRLAENSNDNPTAGTWISRPSVTGTAQVLIDYESDDYEPQVIAEEVYEADADLMVTLHATIDAQLAILHIGNAIFYGNFEKSTPPEVSRLALMLAKAILGEQVDAWLIPEQTHHKETI